MMQLSALTIENYKAFKDPERVAIRPLTILVGRNSAGKSVLSRLPLLLARALSPRAEAPLELEVDGVDFGASFLDLVHNRKRHGAITIGATFATDKGAFPLTVSAKVQHFDEYRLQHVVAFELFDEDNNYLSLEWIGTDPLREGSKYRDREGRSWTVEFRGIVPVRFSNDEVGSQPAFKAMITDLHLSMAKCLEDLTYLGPFREGPRRMYRFPGGTPYSVGSKGSRAPEVLAVATTRGDADLAKRVSEWFAQNLGGWRLEVTSNGDTFSLVLQHPDIPGVDINLADVGVGISQILPVVVQRLTLEEPDASGGLEIIEQPELHLHPAAHSAVAELYIAAAHAGSRLIVETHSEVFLLRVRRAVAEGRLSPEDVAIYWIREFPTHSPRIMPIRVGLDGAIDQWPTGVFSEDFEEVRAIQRAQKGKRG